MYKLNNSDALETLFKNIIARGAKYRNSIMMVLITIFLLPYLLKLLRLKYSATRRFNVEEKSELTDFEKVIFLMSEN